MYAAQWFAAMRRAHARPGRAHRAGDLTPVFDWLRDNIWTRPAAGPPTNWRVRASGEVLNPAHFKAHLEARYLG
jgi:carboxypeptidase Taq